MNSGLSFAMWRRRQFFFYVIENFVIPYHRRMITREPLLTNLMGKHMIKYTLRNKERSRL